MSLGVVISETSLVQQRVARQAAGRYTCHASNAEGEEFRKGCFSPPF